MTYEYRVQCAVERDVCGGEVVAHDVRPGRELDIEVLFHVKHRVAR